jgi:hypothetical protein
LLIGEKNGTLRVQPVPDSKKIEDIKDYWSYGFHDIDYGTITNIELSFNEKFLFTTGSDSNIFGLLFNCGAEELEKCKEEPIRLGTDVITLCFV